MTKLQKQRCAVCDIKWAPRTFWIEDTETGKSYCAECFKEEAKKFDAMKPARQ